jgi:hypothetical protein
MARNDARSRAERAVAAGGGTMNLAGDVVRLYSRNSLSLRTLWVFIGGRPCDNERLELIRGLLARFASSSSQKMAGA